MTAQSYSLTTSLVAIFCDGQNVRGNAIQFQCLMGLAREYGKIAFGRAYASWAIENPMWRKLLARFNFECVDVVSSRHKKNNVDKKLIADCREHVLNNSNVRTVILLSGDGDFKSLVRDLKAKGKRVIVISEHRKRTSRKLVQLADEFYLLRQVF